MSDILITGGTGSFGHAFVKTWLERTTQGRVIVYSRDEVKQWKMAREFAKSDRMRFFVGDVRDLLRLRRALSGVEIVVHAAALKRIEVGHYNPDEMVKTNVIGTMNLIEAAFEVSLYPSPAPRRVVFLSTDKAFQPVSAYGHAKALGESLILAANNMVGKYGPRFAVTRYGNVAGSTGSVIPIWREHCAKGEPLMITDPDCTRFWMTMQQAVDLVMKTIDDLAGDPQVLLNRPVTPDLPAYRLGDLAQAIGGKTIEVGLDRWEKMHESMRDGLSSKTARRMSVEELREALKSV